MSKLISPLSITACLATLFCASGLAASPEGMSAEDPCEAEPVSEAVREIELMNGRLRVASGSFLVFERNGTRLEAAASQPDYGAIIGLRITQNGEIYAVGHQRTYRVSMKTDSEGPVLVTDMLPILFRKPCSWLGAVLSTCKEQGVIFSQSLSAIFLSGYNYNGNYRSYVFGLTEEVIDLSDAETPAYQRDCGKEAVVLVGKKGTSFLDASGSIRKVLSYDD